MLIIYYMRYKPILLKEKILKRISLALIGAILLFGFAAQAGAMDSLRAIDKDGLEASSYSWYGPYKVAAIMGDGDDIIIVLNNGISLAVGEYDRPAAWTMQAAFTSGQDFYWYGTSAGFAVLYAGPDPRTWGL